MVADESEKDVGLWAMADLATPMAVRVAATLRIADHITRGLLTAPELAKAANATLTRSSACSGISPRREC